MVEELICDHKQEDIFEVDSKVDVFITKVLDEHTLASKWKEIRQFVAKDQYYMKDDFERWNFYLFYVVDNPDIDLSLKYEIEHDTISSRKMVITEKDSLYTDLVGKYIKYELKNQEKTFNKTFESNDIIKRFIEHIREDIE